MANKVFKIGKKELDHVCSHDTNHARAEQNYANYFAQDFSDEDIATIAGSIIGSYADISGQSGDSNNLLYIPVVFTISYSNSDEVPLDEAKISKISNNISEIVNRCNVVLTGETTNLRAGQDGNWQTPNDFHNVRTNVRFFLPWKMPKEFLYPFAMYTPSKDLRSTGFSNSLTSYKSQFIEGIDFSIEIDDPVAHGYQSSYSYEDIKDKRLEVINLSSQGNSYELNTAKQELEQMENDYFFFFGNTPGIIFLRVIENPTAGFLYHEDVPGSEVFQLNGIVSVEQNKGDVGGINSNTLYSIYAEGYAPGNLIPSRFPCVTFTAGSHRPGGQELGRAYSSLYLFESEFNNHVQLATAYEHDFQFDEDGNETMPLSEMYNSLVLHEFFHNLGYGHSFDGATISGPLYYKSTDLLLRSTSLSRQSGPNSFDKFYLPFEPPFQYYDPFDESHDINDETTFSDFEDIDPNEKLFVEATFKQLNSITNDFKIFKNNFKINETTGDLYYLNNYAYNLGLNFYQEQYASIFGTISHLPTFWGGSYTTNADGSKSMLINPLTENAVSLEIGQLYKGGHVIQVNQDNTALIALPFDLPVFSNTRSYGIWVQQVQKLNDVSHPFNKDPYINEDIQSGDWRLANIEELQALSQAVLSFPELPSGATDTWFSSTPDSASTMMCSRLISSSTGLPWQGNPWGGSRWQHRRAAIVKTVNVEVGRRGPDITIYNPVCDKDDNTKFNYWLPLTLDWYNPEYPAFPGNTRVEDMFSPELCPCLYTSQTKKVSETETVTFTLFEALQDETGTGTITNTTGTPIESESIRRLNTLYDKDLYSQPKGVANSLFSRDRNAGTNFYEFFGRFIEGAEDYTVNRAWLKQVGGVVIPNFPVYIGFMPESPLPSAFRYDPNKVLTSSGDYAVVERIEKNVFSLYNNVNDPTTYNNWGNTFNTIIDKYIRIGSSDPSSDMYNPFKIDPNTSGLKTYVEGKGVEYIDFESHLTAHLELEPNFQVVDNPTLTFEEFFNRNLPDTTNPALDLIGNTLHGPFDQNTLTNLMYYATNVIETALPTPNHLHRLNYVASLNEGLLSTFREFSDDMYDTLNLYTGVLPDSSQKNLPNTIQAYMDFAIDYIDRNRLDNRPSSGCTDPNAFNYSEDADFDDGSCIEKVFGCMDPDSVNYSPTANTDDGSCEYYSLIPAAVTKIRVCPKEFTGACNSYPGELDGEYLALDIDNILPDTGFDLGTAGDIGTVKLMIEDLNHEHWQNPEKLAVFQKFQYTGGDCNTPLGSTSEGSLNLGGGCVRVLDTSVCSFPTVTRYNCNVIKDAQGRDTGNIIDFEADVLLEGVSKRNLGALEFISYFEALSEDTNIQIGVCEQEDNNS